MKAVLVICEGRSDIAFVRRSLMAIIPDCERFKEGIGNLYTPFGAKLPGIPKGIIARYIENSFKDSPADFRKFAHATILPRPQFDAAVINNKEGVIYLFVDSGGRDQHNGIINLLDSVDAPIKELGNSGDLDVKEYATAFVFDANDRGKDKVIEDFKSNYREYFGCFSNDSLESWVKSDRCPVGLYICCDDNGKGALENYIAPMTELVWPERHRGAKDFIETHSKSSDKVSKSEANKLKAIITAVGQFNFPGDSLLSVIDGKNYKIPDEKFGESKPCNDLVEFLQDVPWED